MKLFISWSKPTSGAIASALRDWLPAVIQAVKPYFSTDDIAKGARWSSSIGAELAESNAGLIILTKENLTDQWIMFEAGALSKTFETSRVCPILFGLELSELQGPLAQFQAAKFGHAEMKRVMSMINSLLGDSALSPGAFEMAFETFWPQLETSVRDVLAGGSAPQTMALRSDRAVLDEVLHLVRALNQTRPDSVNPDAVWRLLSRFGDLLAAVDLLPNRSKLNDALRALYRPIKEIAQRVGGDHFEHRARLMSLLERAYIGTAFSDSDGDDQQANLISGAVDRD